MSVTIGIYFAIGVGVSILGLLGLLMRLQKENDEFVKDLQFSLKHRTINHNRAKAELAILKAKYSKIQSEFEALKAEAIKQDINFSGLLADAEFVEKNKKKAEEETSAFFTLEHP